jgi:hypothetical protein
VAKDHEENNLETDLLGDTHHVQSSLDLPLHEVLLHFRMLLSLSVSPYSELHMYNRASCRHAYLQQKAEFNNAVGVACWAVMVSTAVCFIPDEKPGYVDFWEEIWRRKLGTRKGPLWED